MDSIARANTALFDPFDSNRIFIGGDSVYSYKLLLVSTDMGNSWEHTGNGISGSISKLAASVQTRGLMYAGTAQGLFRSTDGGHNWTRTGTFTDVRSVVIDAQDDRLIYAATNSGVYRTTDGGVSWEQDNEGLIISDILALAFRSQHPRTVFAGSNGGGVYVTTPLIGVNEPGHQVGSLPVPIQVIPNPARRRFELIVQGWEAEPVTGGIYDPSGRLIERLKSSKANGGPIRWMVDLGRSGNGVFFVRMKSRSYELTRRVVIMD